MMNNPGQIGGTAQGPVGGDSPMGATNPMQRQLPYQPSQPPMGQPQGGAMGGNVPRGIPAGAPQMQRFAGSNPASNPMQGNNPWMNMPGSQQGMPNQMPQMPNRGPMGMNPQMWQRLMQMIQMRQGRMGGAINDDSRRRY